MIPYGKHNTNWADSFKVFWQVRFGTLTQGKRILEFEEEVAKYVGAKFAVAVSSATAGLHIALLAAGLKPQSNVITSPLSFVASSNSILYSSCVPVFVDIDTSTLNLDVAKTIEIVNQDQSIKAIIPIHFAGEPVDMHELKNGLNRSLMIIEDAAHALGSTYKTGEKIGSCKFSDMTVFSFHPVKSITTGEGGIVTTNNYELYLQLLRLRSHGITKLNDQFSNPILAKKSIKEVLYHTRFSSDWIKRLGDGTEESHNRIQTAINDLWIFTDELFHQTDADKAMVADGIGVDTSLLKSNYYKKVSGILDEATLQTPVVEYFQKGGKQGIHSEHMGFILTELQYMQRTYPNMTW